MAQLPDRPEQAMAEMIYQSVERQKKKGLVLARMGASSIGRECNRRVYFDWRAFSARETEGRMHLIFETGDIYEKRAIEQLRGIGLAIWDINPSTGKQYSYIHPSGHFVCKVDGVARGVVGAEKTPHILEVKSHNDNQFNSLLKHGVRESHHEHYIQAQMGMHGFELDRALYVAVNKNDDSYYFERLHFNQGTVNEIEAKIQNQIANNLTPPGISQNANAPGCRYCNHKLVCVGKEHPIRHCRTCRASQPVENGEWYCQVHEKNLTYKEQLKGCERYDARTQKVWEAAT